MILSKKSFGNFIFNPLVIGTSDKSEYYPVYTILKNSYSSRAGGKYLPLEGISSNVFLFYKPRNYAELWEGSHRYDDLFGGLALSMKPKVFKFTFNDISHSLHFNKGYIADKDDNILLVLCTNSLEVFNEDNELITENLRLYISTRFIKNEIYKNIYKRIDRDYIHYCYDKGIEVVFTTSEKIEQQVFNNNFKVEFENLTELNEHLNSGVGNNLFFEEDTEEEMPL